MTLVMESFMIDPESKAKMEAFALEDQIPGEKKNLSRVYREAVRDYIKARCAKTTNDNFHRGGLALKARE